MDHTAEEVVGFMEQLESVESHDKTATKVNAKKSDKSSVPNQIGGLSTCERKVLRRKTLRPSQPCRKTTSCTPTCLRGRLTMDRLSNVHGTQDLHCYIPFSRSGTSPSQKGTIGSAQ
jgi:hypothetical protein